MYYLEEGESVWDKLHIWCKWVGGELEEGVEE
jgi:hypothetical protein